MGGGGCHICQVRGGRGAGGDLDGWDSSFKVKKKNNNFDSVSGSIHGAISFLHTFCEILHKHITEDESGRGNAVSRVCTCVISSVSDNRGLTGMGRGEGGVRVMGRSKAGTSGR